MERTPDDPERRPTDEEIAGERVGNSDARFVEPSQQARDRARDDVDHAGAIDSEAEPGTGDAVRP